VWFTGLAISESKKSQKYKDCQINWGKVGSFHCFRTDSQYNVLHAEKHKKK
jgi:hypothetical protein